MIGETVLSRPTYRERHREMMVMPKIGTIQLALNASRFVSVRPASVPGRRRISNFRAGFLRRIFMNPL